MLRFVNCKLDFVIENSRRLLKNSTVSLAQQCQRHAYCFSRQEFSQPVLYKYEAAALVPSITLKEVEVRACHVFKEECSLTTHRQVIHYKDLYECYLQKLGYLYEALNALSIAQRNCQMASSSSEVCLHRDSHSYINEIVYDVDRNLEFMYSKQHTWLEPEHPQTFGFPHALICRADGNLPRDPSASGQFFYLQKFEAPHDSSETFNLKCSNSGKSNVPEDSKESKDSKELKGPSKEKLEAMQEYLVEKFPKFLSETHDYSVYTKDVEFVMNWYLNKSYSTVGQVNYAIELARLKLYVHLRLARVKVAMLRVTSHPEDGSIRVRWRISGLPHSTFLWSYFSAGRNSSDDREWLDGFSVFYLNDRGLIKKHCIERITPEGESVKEKPSMIEKLGLRVPLPT